MTNVTPTGVTADRKNSKLTITWSDNHTSEYSFSLIRHACPCVECRGGHEHMSSEPDPDVFALPDEYGPATQIRKIEPVGGYAVTIEWEDDHHYGIYNWNYLRALCPCDLCRQNLT
jgi:DUF971 family protein